MTNCTSVTQVTAKTKEEAIAKFYSMTEEQRIRRTKVCGVVFDPEWGEGIEPAE